MNEKNSSTAGAGSFPAQPAAAVLQLLALPWRRAGRDDDHIIDEIDFSPHGSATYRHILDNNDELVAIVCVESIDDEAAADLTRRVNLLLAAPDLLRELQYILPFVETFAPTIDRFFQAKAQRSIENIRAAIARATQPPASRGASEPEPRGKATP